MKCKTLLFFCLLSSAFCLFSGCQPGNVRQNQKIDYSKIAGTWKAEKGPWKIVINDHGVITQARIVMCTDDLYPNKTTYVEMRDGQISTFQAGNFELNYDSTHNLMEVHLKLKKILVKIKNEKLEGKKELIFAGNLSNDMNTWSAEMVEFFDYGPRFPQDKNNITPTYITFVKQKD